MSPRTLIALIILTLFTGFAGIPALQIATATTPSEASTTVAASTIVIDTTAEGRNFDRRLLGTNVPAWLNPSTTSDPAFQQRITDLGNPLLRLPGGSWSNAYDWLACETTDAQSGTEGECYWTWAAKPSDFLELLRSTDQEAIWTVSINGSAQEAAALVAFFNGSVNDTRSIGTDRYGKNWGTVATWARLRRDAGFPDPQPIRLWEVGNEVYGGKPGVGPDCSPWGWEDVWTCDGTAYVNGDANHDGYLAFREAMRAVDPSIAVGAVGVDYPGEWSEWGNRVIAAAGDQLDFYVVHTYAYGGYPLPSPSEVLQQPQQIWPDVMNELNAAFDQYAGGRRAPIAVTEYNIFAWQDLDENQLMTKAVNTLFIADTIGQLADTGVSIATQWDMANGQADNGTDYGLVHAETYEPYPQYYAMQLWNQFGNTWLPLTSPYNAKDTLSVYAGRTSSGAITVMAINKTRNPITSNLQLGNTASTWRGRADVLRADSLTARSIKLNGQDAANGAPATTLPDFTQSTSYTFQPYSVTLLRFDTRVPAQSLDEFIYIPIVRR
jgi:hypothetical protein